MRIDIYVVVIIIIILCACDVFRMAMNCEYFIVIIIQIIHVTRIYFLISASCFILYDKNMPLETSRISGENNLGKKWFEHPCAEGRGEITKFIMLLL
jgi:hypothetical protein